MPDDREELIKFAKDVRRLAENPFQRQLEEARRESRGRNSASHTHVVQSQTEEETKNE
jgi:hypothetical protein